MKSILYLLIGCSLAIKVERHFVDVKNLEKISMKAIPNKLMWTGNIFD